MTTGLFTAFSLTADGSGMLMDQGTYDHTVWALEIADLLSGRFPGERIIAHGSSEMSASVSPDGARVLLWRAIPTGPGRAESRFTTMPFPSGHETQLSAPGVPIDARWTDSVTVAVSSRRPGGLRLTQVDVRTGAQRNALDLPDSTIHSFDALADGWVWVPASFDRMVIRSRGRTREVAPDWYEFIYNVTADQNGRSVFYYGQNKTTADSTGVGVFTIDDGVTTQLGALLGYEKRLVPMADGSVILELGENQESISLFNFSRSGKIRRVGAPPRPLSNLTLSRDLKRATALETDYRADAWLSKVIRQ
jgi:hypothetical protein